MTVVYKPMSGLPKKFYRIGNNGVGWSCQKKGRGAGKVGKWRKLKPCPRGKGYLKFRLGVNGVHNDYYIHKLVLEAFVGPCPEGMECRHLDGDRSNNRLSNLCWGTRIENQWDRVKHGTDIRGESCHNSVLNDKSVRKVRKLFLKHWTVREIAEAFLVSPETIRDVLEGRTWRHVA